MTEYGSFLSRCRRLCFACVSFAKVRKRKERGRLLCGEVTGKFF